MSKPVKNMIVSELEKRLGGARDLLVVDPSKLDAFAANKLRINLAKKGIRLLGVKNTLARHALKSAGVTSLDASLQGPSALVFGGPDIVALAKEIVKVAKDTKDLVKVKGGTVDGQPLDAAGVEALSKSPGREELIGRILMLIRSPGGTLVSALNGPGGLLAGQVKTLADKEPEGEAAPAPEAG